MIGHDEATLYLVRHFLVQALQNVYGSEESKLDTITLNALFELTDCGDQQCIEVLLQPYLVHIAVLEPFVLTLVLVLAIFSANYASLFINDFFEDKLFDIHG